MHQVQVSHHSQNSLKDILMPGNVFLLARVDTVRVSPVQWLLSLTVWLSGDQCVEVIVAYGDRCW